MQNFFTKSVLFFLLLLTFFDLSACYAVQNDQIILVDTRMMLLAHPVFNKFDPETRRFKDSRSEPVLGEAGREEIKAELASSLRILKLFNDQWAEKLKNSSGSKRKELEKQYMTLKAKLEAKVVINRERYWASDTIPGQPGRTEPASVISSVNEIAKDIRDSILSLKTSNNADLVIDLAALLPSQYPYYDMGIVQENQIGWMVQGKPHDKKTIRWLKEAKKYWLKQAQIWNPVLIGGKDMREEAVLELEKNTRGKY